MVHAGVLGQFTPCASPEIWREYVEVLGRPEFRFPQQVVLSLLKDLREQCLMVVGESWPSDLPDPDDAIFLEAAKASSADFLVTGNLKHFPPKVRQGVRVLSAAEFLALIQEGRKAPWSRS